MANSTITVPNIGDLSDVEVIEISVKVGDQINQEDPLITLESDKAAMDIPSPKSGQVTGLLVQLGDKLSEGSEILTIETDSKDEAPNEKPSPPSYTEEKPESTYVTDLAPSPDINPISSLPHAGPAVRKLARKLGVLLQQVSGSGPHRRILKEDVQAYVKAKLSQSSNNGLPPRPEIDFSQFGEVKREPLSKINQLTGQNTLHSWSNIPHVTQFDEANISDIEDFRQSIKQEYATKGIKLTILPFLVKAAVSALKELPRFNSSLDTSGENLILKSYFNIGIAVDTPRGLVVPVIRNADCKSITDIALEIAELANKAQHKKLKITDLQGGCFTISSLGHLSGTAFTPIINEPEVAILGVSPAKMKPIYNGQVFQPQLMLPLSLSYDHRVIDGVLAAKCTQHLTAVLKDARKMLL